MRRWAAVIGALALLAAAGLAVLIWQQEARREASSPARTSPAGPAATDADAGGEVAEPATASPERLREALRDPNWRRRLGSVWQLVERDELPVRERVALVVESLRFEMENPTEAPPPEGAYLPVTALVRLDTSRALGRLGARDPGTLRDLQGDAGEEAAAWIAVARGQAGDRDVVPELRRLVRESASGPVRMQAAHLLGELGALEAIPDLRAALQDPFAVTFEQHGRQRTLHPVREQAAGALEELGLEVELEGKGTYRVLQP